MSQPSSAISDSELQNAVPFGKYRLIKRLAVGGMAELFLATEEGREEPLVIKRILPHLSREAEFVQMFLDEARIASQLHHPAIIQLIELGRLQDAIFIAMEHVDGVDMRRVLQEEVKLGLSIPYGIVAYVMAQICAGLHYAHTSQGVDGKLLGVIHRDVSPQNVMVTFDGRVKLVDFGIAKASALVERSKPGVVKGKFLYLSPEQLGQMKLDHRSDLFSLGSMMYELSTGHSPFYRPTTEGVITAVRFEDPPPPTQGRADYPAELSRVVMKCLVKDWEHRYQSAADVQKDLEAFLSAAFPTDGQALAAYVQQLLGAAEGTSGEKEARPSVLVPAQKRSSPNLGRTPRDSQPTTQASPEDVARAQQGARSNVVSELPGKKSSRDDIGGRPGTVVMRPDWPRSNPGAGAVADLDGPKVTTDERLSGRPPSSEPSGSPRYTEELPDPSLGRALVDGDSRNTANIDSGELARHRLRRPQAPPDAPKRPLVWAAIAFGAAVVFGTLVLLALRPPFGSGNRVPVLFHAPPGTQITDKNEQRYAPDVTFRLDPGLFFFVYRCPGSTTYVPTQATVPQGRRETLIVTVPCLPAR